MPLLLPLALCGVAFAFQPEPGLAASSSPPRRVHIERQHALRHGTAWQAFLAGEGRGWSARFDEATGLPRRAWGPRIDLGQPGDPAPEVVRFLSRHPQLVGVSSDRLILARSVQVPGTDHWILRFDQVADGSPLFEGPDPQGILSEQVHPDLLRVWRSGVTVHVDGGRLVALGVETAPEAAVDPVPGLSADAAVRFAAEQGPVPEALHEVQGVALVVVPARLANRVSARLAWAVLTRTSPSRGEPPGIWSSLVDAHTGELLGVENLVRYAAGTVWGTHDARTVTGDYEDCALAWLDLSGAEGTTVTGKDGSFELDGDTVELDSLEGRYFRVQNSAGADGYAAWTDGDRILTEVEATQAEIDSYVFLSHVREWVLGHGPDLGIATEQLTSNVNMTSSCNAYYDGDVNFFSAGGGCNNTGRIADVNYHEWGHGLHAYAAGTWYVDGAVGEGAGDVTAFLQTGDSTIAPYFFTSGAGIRDVAADREYPDDWTGEVHTDGLIFAGAVWDLWDLLAQETSTEEARELLSGLFVEALRENFETDTAFDAFLTADDDDGDLSNGTPHQCAIVEAFSRHGLGPAGGAGLVQLSHLPLPFQPSTAEEYPVEADILNLVPDCFDAEVSSASVMHSTDGGGEWQSAALQGDATGVWGAIPAVSPGTVVTYYLAADAGDQGEVTAPLGGAITPMSFYVGELEELWCADFEEDDGGFTAEQVSRADEWAWGEPRGKGGDPDFAASGQRVWGTDLGDGRDDGEYDNGSESRLSSPPIDVQGQDRVVVRYERWLTVEDGIYDQARVLANGEVAWQNHASSRQVGDEHHEENQWVPHTLLVDLDGAPTLTLEWDLTSDRALSMGGWNIDNVCVYAPAVPVADTGEPTDPPPAAPTEGCGCAAGGHNGTWWGAALLALGGVWRRRRRTSGASPG